MTLNRRIRLVLLGVVNLLLLWLAWTGLSGGVHQFSQSKTPGQTAQTIMQVALGVFALLGVVTTFWGRQWNRAMLAAWIASVTLAAGLASVVWGGTSLLVGMASAGGALVVGLGVAWLQRVGARGLPWS